MAVNKGFRQNDAEAWIENSEDLGIDRRVNDSIAHNKLDTIAAGLGISNTTTTIINASIALANTEVSQILPVNTKKFSFRSRSKGTIKLAYNVGETSTDYITVTPGNTYSDTNFYNAQTIYFQSTKAGDTLEIVVHV